MWYQGDDIGITALGLVSPVGYGAEVACASARAGLTRLSEIDLLNPAGMAPLGEGPAVGHCIRQIGHGFSGYAKSLLLAEHALSEVKSKRRLTMEEEARTGLVVILSDRYFEDRRAKEARAVQEELRNAAATDAGDDDEDPALDHPVPSELWRRRCASFLPDLVGKARLAIPPERQRVLFGGHAALIEAIEASMRAINDRIIDRAIIGAVDSLVEPAAFTAAAECGVVYSEANPAGFFPSEAAGFFLLERAPAISLIRASSRSRDEERLADTPALGKGLAECIAQVLEPRAQSGRVGMAMVDLNGDAHRAQDWGNALVRLPQTSDVRQCPTVLPALSFGETGAAQGVLAVIYASRGYQRSYWPNTRSLLVTLASESGERGALLLEPGAK